MRKEIYNGKNVKYKKPVVVNLMGMTKGTGNSCGTGSGATEMCDATGNSADACQTGNVATIGCTTGNSYSGPGPCGVGTSAGFCVVGSVGDDPPPPP